LSQNFSLRKFEKVFQKSFSSFQQNKFKKLKNQQNSFEKNFLSITKSNEISNQTPFSKDLTNVLLLRKQSKDTSKPESLFSEKNSFLQMHSKKDNILLKSLSTSFQNFYNSSQSSILLSSNKKTSEKMQTSLNSFNNFYCSEPSENFFKKPWTTLSTEEIRKMNCLQNKKEFEKNKNFIAPDIILKRDGFLFYPSKQKFFSKNSNSQVFKIFEYSETQKQNKSFSNLLNKQNIMFVSNFQENSQKQNNVLFEQRFEKEKHLQRKRRLKKQKLETRRRKKENAFFLVLFGYVFIYIKSF